jgi:Na+-driven multidrug efflux pump
LVTGSDTAAVLETGSLYLRVDTLFYFVPAAICIIRNAMQGFDDRITPIVSSSIELVGKVLVVILLVPHYQYWAIIVAEPIVWVLMVIPLLVRLFTNPVLKK